MNIAPIKQYLGFIIGAAKDYREEFVDGAQGDHCNSLNEKIGDDETNTLKWLKNLDPAMLRKTLKDAQERIRNNPSGVDSYLQENFGVETYELDAEQNEIDARGVLDYELLSHAARLYKLIKEQSGEKTSEILSNLDKVCNGIQTGKLYWDELAVSLNKDDLKLVKFAFQTITSEKTHENLRTKNFPQKILTHIFNSLVENQIEFTDFAIELAGKETTPPS